MLYLIEKEFREAINANYFIRIETSLFLSPLSESQPASHERDADMRLAALAVVGFLRGGVALGAADSCGLLLELLEVVKLKPK